ncbi:unnamed protein product [Effrenium voratum]|nr:unnamed protein product [Effrenium voratum]
MRRMRLGLATRRRLYSATPLVRAETGVQLEGPPEGPEGAEAAGLRRRELQSRILEAGAEDLQQLVAAEIHLFDEDHAVTSLERFCVLGLRDAARPLLAALSARLAAQRLAPGAAARLGAVSARLRLEEPLALVAEEAQRRADHFGNRELAVLSRSLALGGQGAAVEALVASAAVRRGALGARALVRLCWAAATARAPSPELDLVLEEAATRAGHMQPQAMTNLLWAMASLRNRNEDALRSLLPHVVDRCRDLAPQGLATCLWGLAALRPPNARPGWLEEDAILRLSVQSMRRIASFSPEDLGAVARATAIFAACQTRAKDFGPLAEAVLCEAARRELPARQLARTLGALARMKCRDKDNLERLAGQVNRRAEDLDMRQAAAILWASASLQLDVLAPLSRRVAELLGRGLTGDSSEFAAVAGLVWAAAVEPLAESRGDFCRDFGAWDVAVSAEGAPSHQLASLAVAGARLGLAAPKLFAAAAQETRRRAKAQLLESQDCALAARGFAALGFQDLLEDLSSNFLHRVARPIAGSDTGRDWADIVEALTGTETELTSPACAELMAAFDDAVVQPLVHHLEEIAASTKSRREALAALEAFCANLALPSLGFHATRRLLGLARLATWRPLDADDADAGAEAARKAAAVRRWSSASVRGAWLSFDLGDRGEPGLWLAPGKGVEQAWGLRPLALPSVSAAGRHAEHQALLKLLGAAFGGAAGAGSEVQGAVWIHSFGPVPCLSFLAGLAQLKALCPKLTVMVGFEELNAGGFGASGLRLGGLDPLPDGAGVPYLRALLKLR